MTQRSRVIDYSGALFALIGAVISAILVAKHSFPDLIESSVGCDIGGIDRCKALGETEYAYVFGIPIAAFGFFYYSLVLVTFLRIAFMEHPGKLLGLIVFLGATGVLVDIVLGVINLGILEAPCLLCIYTYITTAGVMIMAAMLFRSEAKSRKVKPSAAIDWMALGIHSGIALLMSIALYGCLSIFSPSGGPPAGGVPLIPEDQVDLIVQDFETLPEAKLDSRNLETMGGSENGYIVIHEFADFLCPHCRHTTEMITELKKRWPGRIKVYYRQFPLDGTCNPMIQGVRKPIGDWRCNSAQAAVCAGGSENFGPFIHDLFALQDNNPPVMTPETIRPVAEKHGMNWDNIYKCMGSPRAQQLINADVEAGRSIEINSTPLVIVNDRILSRGSPHEQFFFQLVDALVYKKEGQAAFEELKKRSRGN